MLGNMLNDLAEAIRRWTEKKSNTCVAGIRKVTNHSAHLYFELWEDCLDLQALGGLPGPLGVLPQCLGYV